MKISLTQKEIGYLLHLINESLVKKTDTKDNFDEANAEEDVELIDKLETALKLLDIKKYGLESAVKEKPLN